MKGVPEGDRDITLPNGVRPLTLPWPELGHIFDIRELERRRFDVNKIVRWN